MAVPDRAVADAIRAQARACGQLGSPLWARVLQAMGDDHARGGVSAELLDGHSAKPVHDAIVLRLLGGLHRLALQGRAPALAACLPSCGGDGALDPAPAFHTALVEHVGTLRDAMRCNVQTNEVARAAALVGGFVEVARRAAGLPLHTLEVGSSAGLLMNWDRYRYETGPERFGPVDSPLVLTGNWRRAPRLGTAVFVAGREGCDISPVDATTDEGALTLASFVWPDQLARLHRLRAAITVARAHPPVVAAADAGAWLEERLGQRRDGRATVVHHSIVLQYLPHESIERLRVTLAHAGTRATTDAPLAWLRMEPAGRLADVRLTWWPGGHETVLGTAGFHGQDITWR